METAQHDIIVVGAGISGLTAAWQLHQAGRDVLLLESGAQVGGAIQTEQRDGFLLEKGPFNVMVRDPSFEALLEDFADEVKVVTASDAAKKNRYIYRHGKLVRVPTGPLALLTSPLLSFGGRLRAIRGLFFSQRGKQEDTTFDEFFTRRFGPEVSDTLISAAMSGILAGDIRKLSVYANFPFFIDFDHKSISPLGRSLRRVVESMTKPKKKRRWKGLVSLDRGLGALPDTIASRLGERAITNASITAIERTEDGFVVQGVDRSWRAKQLVLGTPAEKTAEFIAPFSPDAAALLRGIESVSLVVLNLAFERGAIEHPLDGFGFLTPRNEPDFPLMGVLWADSAFPHHAPPDQHLLRVFIGGVRTPDAHTWSDDQLLETALSGLRPALGVSGDPTLVDICRYDVAIPQYYLGHRARIEQVTGLVHSVPNLFLTGNYLNGVSINDCVRVGKETADQVLANTPHQGAAS